MKTIDEDNIHIITGLMVTLSKLDIVPIDECSELVMDAVTQMVNNIFPEDFD